MVKNQIGTLVDFIEKYSNRYGQRTFLREKVRGVWTETSYSCVREQSRVIAAGLIALGLEKGDRVALLSEGRNDWILAEFGILYAAGVNVPLSFKLESDVDICFRINHSDARFVIVSSSQLAKVRRIRKMCEKLQRVIVMDDIPLQEGEMTLVELRRMGAELLEKDSLKLDERSASVRPEDYANISYTSGTTSDPKGVLLTHGNYVANVEHCRSLVFLPSGSIELIILPLDHCFAHVAGLYYSMGSGGSLATVPFGNSPVTMLKNIPSSIREVRPNMILAVPALVRSFKKSIEKQMHTKGPLVYGLYRLGVRNAEKYNREYYNAGIPPVRLFWRKPLKFIFDRLIFSKIRKSFGNRLSCFIGGGASLDIALQRYFMAIGMPVFQGYGLSEATPVVSSNFINHSRFGTAGRVAYGIDVKICDESGNELSPGEKGEILVRGANVMAGYWKNPETTAKTVVDGWLHTGDRGFLCPEDTQYLCVSGRFKSLLISSDGEKYSPEGYEDSIMAYSKYVDGAMLYNNQSPYTVLLLIPSKNTLAADVAQIGLDPYSEEGRRMQLDLLHRDVESYRRGGENAGLFPEKWLPSAIIVGDEPFSEKNGMLNSTSKLVRGVVEKYYRERIAHAMTADGKNLYNSKNINSL